MNLDLIIKTVSEGKVSVTCSNFPNCECQGSSIDEALEALIDKIALKFADDIRTNLRSTFKDVSLKISTRGQLNVPLMMTKLPLSLN